MAIDNRAERIKNTYKVLKKHYSPFSPDPKRSVLEHLLYACCLQNSLPDEADLVFKRVQKNYFDLNEVRVSTVRELAEIMKPLFDPQDSARRFKGVLQSVFELTYSYDIESFKKQNIGQAVKTMDEYEGTTAFMVAYVTQSALAGHSIPINPGVMRALIIVGVLTEAEARKGRVPGLERTISKAKGIEFGSLLHQLGVALRANPYSPAIRKILLEIDPGCRELLPKRPSRATKKAVKTKAPEKVKASEKTKKTEKKPVKKTAKTAVKKKATTKKKAVAKKKATSAKSATKKKVKKPTATKKPKKAKAAVSKKKTAVSKKKTAVSKKKTTSRGISKRKPK